MNGRNSISTTLALQPPAPEVIDLELVNDTETAGDLVTTDNRISGSIQANFLNYDAINIEIDVDGDDLPEKLIPLSDLHNGSFVADLKSLGLKSGSVTARFRASG